jgi:alpha-methylacyl-CoA racemase
MSGPLHGLQIVEMVGIGPAPFAAMMLADQGADVIRIHQKGGRPEIPLQNSRFDILARNRRSIALDLKAEGGSALARALIGKADGLIEGFRPGVMERLGLGPDLCCADNPRLVYGRMTGWGQTGPLAHTVGHDLNYLALTGALHAMGSAGAPPPVPLNLVADFGGGGMVLAFGMVTGLLQAQRSGQGQVIDAAMVDGASLLAGMFWGFRAGGAWSDQREANLLDGGAYFYTTYACQDGKFLAVAAIEKRFHTAFLERLKLDPAVFTHLRNPAAWPDLRARLAALFLQKPRDEWAALFADSEACVTPVLDWQEAAHHPHMQARQAFIDMDGVKQPAPAPRFSAHPSPQPTSVAEAGADTAAILRDWGIDAALIETAQASGAL